jgi:tRNA(Ile)-lysidine synthase
MLISMDSILKEQCLLEPGRPVLAAVSGGPDSLCLMDVLHQAGYKVIVAYFNHKLRDESDEEAAGVEKIAAKLGIPFVTESADVRAYSAAMKLSIEEAARNLRYTFLFEQARAHNAQAVAVGHTADDQVETVLMHFLRGAGLRGLKGMTYRTVLAPFDPAIPVVRPLLDVWREETVVYCAGQGFRPVHDPSNESLNFLRNRIRHLLIPNLETYNPKFREAAWRTAQLLSADQEIVRDAVAATLHQTIVTESESLVVFDAISFLSVSHGMQRYLIRAALERILPQEEAGYSILDRAVAFVTNPGGRAHFSLPGDARLLREQDRIYIAARDALLPFERWPQLPADVDVIPLTVPGTISLPGGWMLSCEMWNIPVLAWEQMQANEDPYQAWLDADRLTGDLSVRIRRDGDRFEPLGLGGHTQKISDFFTNAKLPQRARDRWPLLSLGETIVWVPGFQPADPYRLTKRSRQILYLTLTPPKNVPTPAEE